MQASLIPRFSCGGGGKRAWYTLFAHVASFLGNLHALSYICVCLLRATLQTYIACETPLVVLKLKTISL